MAKALFLDRDGTINEDRAYVHAKEDFAFIDGVFDFCRRAQEKGYLVIVVTNQSGIARGYYTEADYRKLTDWMVAEFARHGVTVADVFHCPSLEGPDRKPEPDGAGELSVVEEVHLLRVRGEVAEAALAARRLRRVEHVPIPQGLQHQLEPAGLVIRRVGGRRIPAEAPAEMLFIGFQADQALDVDIVFHAGHLPQERP